MSSSPETVTAALDREIRLRTLWDETITVHAVKVAVTGGEPEDWEARLVFEVPAEMAFTLTVGTAFNLFPEVLPEAAAPAAEPVEDEVEGEE